MKLISIHEDPIKITSPKQQRRLWGLVKKHSGDHEAVAREYGVETNDVSDAIRQVFGSRGRTISSPVDGALRKLYIIMKDYGVPPNILNKIIQFHKSGMPGGSPMQHNEQVLVNKVLNGKKLIAHVKADVDIQGLSSIEDLAVASSHKHLYIFKPENADVAEYINSMAWPVSSANFKASEPDIVFGLALGYPANEVYNFYHDLS